MIRRYLIPFIALVTASSAIAAPLDGLSAADVNGPAAVAPLEKPQPPARLIVDPPLAGPLSKGPCLFSTAPKTCALSPSLARRR
ncbi:Uncharacterised protein [Enterobacter cancerogenus]|uniref:Uncharacterized protein n=1 Tax=Enterobacter cancerogenus TaxID=69218 RepID=A0A484YWJ1_9ENTR|nr:Uncharacterised protein [Enterobacter cancerogenus]